MKTKHRDIYWENDNIHGRLHNFPQLCGKKLRNN